MIGRVFGIVLIFSLFVMNSNGQRKKRQRVRAVVPETPAEPSEDIPLLFDSYHFEEAQEKIQEEVEAAQKKKQTTERIEALLPKVIIGENMFQATEKVIFIDSFVVNKKTFLQAYRISANCGKIADYKEIFPNVKNVPESVTSSTVFINELNDQMLFSNPKDRGVRLYSSAKIGNEWTTPAHLSELGDSTDVLAYPFLMSDGTTLYYASQDANSLGGYDVYVTRFNTDTKKYVKPENLGMPYNSPANDYLYVIDEENSLGWFASDRYQPEGKVCIYVFIPTDSRETYNIDESNIDRVRALARIESIRLSQTNRQVVEEARSRLASVGGKDVKASKNSDVCFYVASGVVYTSEADFKSDKAKQMFLDWFTRTNQRKELLSELEMCRHLYAQKKDLNMKANILRQEKNLEQLDEAIKTIENDIRKEEQAKLK